MRRSQKCCARNCKRALSAQTKQPHSSTSAAATGRRAGLAMIKRLRPRPRGDNSSSARAAGSACTNRMDVLAVAAPNTPATITQTRKKTLIAKPVLAREQAPRAGRPPGSRCRAPGWRRAPPMPRELRRHIERLETERGGPQEHLEHQEAHVQRGNQRDQMFATMLMAFALVQTTLPHQEQRALERRGERDADRLRPARPGRRTGRSRSRPAAGATSPRSPRLRRARLAADSMRTSSRASTTSRASPSMRCEPLLVGRDQQQHDIRRRRAPRAARPCAAWRAAARCPRRRR